MLWRVSVTLVPELNVTISRIRDSRALLSIADVTLAVTVMERDTLPLVNCYRSRVCASTSYVHERWICSEGEAWTRQYGESELDTVRLRTTSPGNCNLVIARWSVRRGRDR